MLCAQAALLHRGPNLGRGTGCSVAASAGLWPTRLSSLKCNRLTTQNNQRPVADDWPYRARGVHPMRHVLAPGRRLRPATALGSSLSQRAESNDISGQLAVALAAALTLPLSFRTPPNGSRPPNAVAGEPTKGGPVSAERRRFRHSGASHLAAVAVGSAGRGHGAGRRGEGGATARPRAVAPPPPQPAAPPRSPVRRRGCRRWRP